MAKKSGVSAKAIQRLEENEREMDTDQLDRICRALGISVMDFVARANTRMSPHANAPNAQADTRTAR